MEVRSRVRLKITMYRASENLATDILHALKRQRQRVSKDIHILKDYSSGEYSGSGNFLGISGNGNSRKFPGIPDPHLAFPDRILEILNILSAFP